MKAFVPLSDDALDARALRGIRLVPYRCGLPFLPADDGLPPPPASGADDAPRDPPISAAA